MTHCETTAITTNWNAVQEADGVDRHAGTGDGRGGRVWGERGVGAGAGKLLDHQMKSEIKADVEDELPPDSSGIVALFEERWVTEVEKALANADKVSTHEVDPGSVEGVKADAAQAEPVR